MNPHETQNITLEINIAEGRTKGRGHRHHLGYQGHGHRGHRRKEGHMNEEHHHRRGRGHRHGHSERAGLEGAGMRRRRMMSGDQLKLVLMHLLREKTRHGYDLIKEIETLSNGAYVPSAGVVYPSLSLLADMGRLTVREDAEGRKLFDLTPKGLVALKSEDEELQAVLVRLSRLGNEREKLDGGPVRRAMHNLKAAMRGRLAGEEVDHDTLLKAAAILDEAAAKIERL